MKNKLLIIILSICLSVSVICNIYQSVSAYHKNILSSAMSSELSKLTETVTSLQTNLADKDEELSQLNKQFSELSAEVANQKEKYWTLAIADYKITLQEGQTEDTLDLMYYREEKEELLLTLQMYNDYLTPEDISAEAFENCLGHSGFRLYKRRPLGSFYYYEVEYYAMEDELELLAYRWGNKDDDFYEVDIDGDGIEELICNVTWMADGVTDVFIYHFDGRKVWKGFGSDLLDQPVDIHGIGSLSTTYLPDKNKVKIDYWQDRLQAYATTEYDIDFAKIEWWETFK